MFNLTDARVKLVRAHSIYRHLFPSLALTYYPTFDKFVADGWRVSKVAPSWVVHPGGDYIDVEMGRWHSHQGMSYGMTDLRRARRAAPWQGAKT